MIIIIIAQIHSMDRTKLRRSLVKFNQNDKQVSQHLTFLPLLSLSHGQLRILQQGLTVIQELSSGRTFLIAVYSRSSSLINAIYRNNNVLPDEHRESGVWISSYPRLDYQNHRQFLFLHVLAKTQEDMPLLHAFCSAVASAIITDTSDAPLKYLTSLTTRVIFNSAEINENANLNGRKKEVANMVLIRRARNKEAVGEMRRNQREADELLSQLGMEGVGDLHRIVALLRLSSDALQGQNQAYLSNLQLQLTEIASACTKNQDLRNGPILRQYVQLVGHSLARTGLIDITASTNSIRISEGYHAFLHASEFYQSLLKRQLREQGVGNIRQILKEAREDTLEQFKKQSNDAGYLLRITEHIDQTEQKLIEQNNKILDLRNLAFLRQASDRLLGKMSAGRVGQQQVQGQMDAMVSDYKSRAQGDNKFQILTNYLNILHLAVSKNLTSNETLSLKKELDSTRRDRDELEQRLEALRRDNSNKCCEIM